VKFQVYFLLARLNKEELPSKDQKYFEKWADSWRNYKQKIEVSPLSPNIWKFEGNRPAN
jgi:hypothetical protein